MSRNLSEDLKNLNQRLELGVEWVERPIVYRSPTPLAEPNETPPGETISYHDVVQAFEKNVRDYPGDSYPVKMGNERHYRMVPKEAIILQEEVNAPQGAQLTPNIEMTKRRVRSNSRALWQTTHPILNQRASSTRQPLRSVDFGSTPPSNLTGNINVGRKPLRQRQTTNRVSKPQAQAQNCQSQINPGNQPLRRSDRIALLQKNSDFRRLQEDGEKLMQGTLDSAVNADGYDSEEQKAGHNTTSERRRVPPGCRRPQQTRAAPTRSIVRSGKTVRPTKSHARISPTSTSLRRSTRMKVRSTNEKG